MIKDIFPTKIYEGKVSNYKVIQEEFDAIEKGIKWHNLWDTHLISDPNFQENILPYHFSQELKNHIYSYTGSDGWSQQASWMARLEPGHYAAAHHHGHSDLSGVYYYKTTGDDGDLFFQTPNLASTTSVWSNQPHTISMPPDQGKLILFPGYLMHGIRTNTTVHTRLSISFNMRFDR
tara:strand:+ start:639 stop:1169 length:531 start_codon:yes stop_codon:yes gene_type:complete